MVVDGVRDGGLIDSSRVAVTTGLTGDQVDRLVADISTHTWTPAAAVPSVPTTPCWSCCATYATTCPKLCWANCSAAPNPPSHGWSADSYRPSPPYRPDTASTSPTASCVRPFAWTASWPPPATGASTPTPQACTPAGGTAAGSTSRSSAPITAPWCSPAPRSPARCTTQELGASPDWLSGSPAGYTPTPAQAASP